MGFDDGGGCGRDVAAGGLRSGLDHRRRRGRGGGGRVGVVRGHHAREYWRDGGSGCWLGRRSLRWGRVRGRGPMRDEEGPAVDPRSGVLWIPRFGVTWRQKISALF